MSPNIHPFNISYISSFALQIQLLTSFVFLASGASPFPAACPFPFESSPGRLVAIVVNLLKFVTSKHESTQYTDTFLYKKGRRGESLKMHKPDQV